jgi:hypothetical protein
MEKQTADLIALRIEEMLRDIGVDPKAYIETLALQLTGKLLTKAEHDSAGRSFRETLKEGLQIEKYPEPSPEQLTEILIRLKRAGPEIRKPLIEAGRKIRAKAGGRPRELAKDNAEARLCTLISQQLAQGIEKPEAIRNAATRFAVSYWTAKRAWKRYQEAAKARTKKKIERSNRDRRARPRSAI